MATATKPIVLLVEDNPETRGLVEIGARHYCPPFDLEFAASAEEACRKLSSRCYSALVIDVNLLGPTGVSVAAEAHEKCPQMPKAFWTAYDRSITHEHADEFGMETWPKPMTNEELFARVEQLLERGVPIRAEKPLAVPGVLHAVATTLLAAAGLTQR